MPSLLSSSFSNTIFIFLEYYLHLSRILSSSFSNTIFIFLEYYLHLSRILSALSSTDVQVSVQEELSDNQNVNDENDEDDEFQQSNRSSSASMKENEFNRNLIDENDYAVYHCYRELSDAMRLTP